jgi:hypothetical protein
VLWPEREDCAKEKDNIALHAEIDRDRRNDEASEIQPGPDCADMRTQKGGRDQPHGDARRAAAISAIGDPSGDRR